MPSVIRGDDNFDSGSVGSTAFGAVGTYIWGYKVSAPFTEGSTHAGSAIQPAGVTTFTTTASDDGTLGGSSMYWTKGGSVSGTWRAMGRSNYNTNTVVRFTLFVRIS